VDHAGAGTQRLWNRRSGRTGDSLPEAALRRSRARSRQCGDFRRFWPAEKVGWGRRPAPCQLDDAGAGGTKPPSLGGWMWGDVLGKRQITRVCRPFWCNPKRCRAPHSKADCARVAPAHSAFGARRFSPLLGCGKSLRRQAARALVLATGGICAVDNVSGGGQNARRGPFYGHPEGIRRFRICGVKVAIERWIPGVPAPITAPCSSGAVPAVRA
jgi:hypothetical protein